MANPQHTSPCFICEATRFETERYYSRCLTCGHESLAQPEEQGFIINDILNEKDIRKEGFLDRFRLTLTARFQKLCKAESLLDIGSASGKFLLLANSLFARSQGVEITPAAVEFSRGLGLDIKTDIQEVQGPLELVTMWHSMEHIPTKELKSILSHVSKNIKPNGMVIVSVPNAGSFQARILRNKAPFFDYPNHIHQFSRTSLTTLMDRYDFVPIREHYSYPYSLFGCLQGMLNIFNTRHNYLYYRLKRGWTYDNTCLRMAVDGYNLLLAFFFAIPAATLGLMESLSKEKQGVLTICFKKKSA